MDETIHDSEIVTPVRAGLVADAEGARLVGEEAAEGTRLSIVAQCGMKQGEGLAGVPWHDDTRVMLAQAGLEALVLATSPRVAFELDSLVADYKLPVWRMPPFARNFAEATELARRIRQRGTIYRVSSWWEAVAENVLWAWHRKEGFTPEFARLRIAAPGPPLQSWRAGRLDGPGGVLATDGYDLLECLVALRKLPVRVFAGISAVRRRAGETPRETESAASVVMSYETGTHTSVEAVWEVAPFGQSAEFHGPECSIAVEPERVAIIDEDGEVLEEQGLATATYLRNELERFAELVRSPAPVTETKPTIERHIAVSALLQAIYLSAQTGQPESPRKFYEVQAWPEPRW